MRSAPNFCCQLDDYFLRYFLTAHYDDFVELIAANSATVIRATIFTLQVPPWPASFSAMWQVAPPVSTCAAALFLTSLAPF